MRPAYIKHSQVGVCSDPKAKGTRVRYQGSSERLYKQLMTKGQGTDVATDSHCWDQEEYPPSVLDHDVVKINIYS